MRKPTREEVKKAISEAYDRLHADRTGTSGDYIADAIMALLEDKPTPKWEEGFNDLWADLSNNVAGEKRGYPPLTSQPAILKDFIREKLREFSKDCIPNLITPQHNANYERGFADCSHYYEDKRNDAKKKWGL